MDNTQYIKHLEGIKRISDMEIGVLSGQVRNLQKIQAEYVDIIMDLRKENQNLRLELALLQEKAT